MNNTCWGILLFALLVGGCKKLINTNPPATQLTEATVFTNDVAAAEAMNYVLIQMAGSSGSIAGKSSIGVVAGLSADEYATINPADRQVWLNELTAAWQQGIWGEMYRLIHPCNVVIEGVQNPAIAAPVRDQLTGEALFLRSFLHFYLVNLYGAIPLVTTTDVSKNNRAVRTTVDKVYQQIIADLKQAQQLLGDGYCTPLGAPTGDRVRPNKWAATALLARVYLYTRQYALAEAEASDLIGYKARYGLVSLDSISLKNNRESIWQLEAIAATVDTWDGADLILQTGPDNLKPVYMSNLLYDSFVVNDLRKLKWTKRTNTVPQYPFPYKYKIEKSAASGKSEYFMMLRLAEQYLIRAEARAQQGNIQGALEDLDAIRKRAGLPALQVVGQEALLRMIECERQFELFAEWGHRWLDLKRTGRIEVVMNKVTALKGGVWKSHQQWYPIPPSEIQANPHLVQTPGY